MSKECQNCGERNAIDARFCEFCGKLFKITTKTNHEKAITDTKITSTFSDKRSEGKAPEILAKKAPSVEALTEKNSEVQESNFTKEDIETDCKDFSISWNQTTALFIAEVGSSLEFLLKPTVENVAKASDFVMYFKFPGDTRYTEEKLNYLSLFKPIKTSINYRPNKNLIGVNQVVELYFSYKINENTLWFSQQLPIDIYSSEQSTENVVENFNIRIDSINQQGHASDHNLSLFENLKFDKSEKLNALLDQLKNSEAIWSPLELLNSHPLTEEKINKTKNVAESLQENPDNSSTPLQSSNSQSPISLAKINNSKTTIQEIKNTSKPSHTKIIYLLIFIIIASFALLILLNSKKSVNFDTQINMINEILLDKDSETAELNNKQNDILSEEVKKIDLKLQETGKELACKSDCNNAKSHPSLSYRLKLLPKLKPSTLFMIKEINIKPGIPQKTVTIQYKTSTGSKTKVMKINDSFKIEDKSFTISDIQSVKKKVFNQNLWKELGVTIGKVKITDSTSHENTLAEGEKIKEEASTKQRVQDTYTGKIYFIEPGTIIELGDARTGTESFKVIKVKLNYLELSNVQTNKLFIIQSFVQATSY